RPMPQVEVGPEDARAGALYAQARDGIHRRVDRLFAGLMLAELLAGIAAATWLSPLTWDGLTSRIHPHVWASVVLAPILVSLPVVLTFLRPGRPLTRHAIAAAQMLMGGLLIQFTGGRIETHFIVFGSLAFLAFYRDAPVLITATVVVAVDHLLRGVL